MHAESADEIMHNNTGKTRLQSIVYAPIILVLVAFGVYTWFNLYQSLNYSLRNDDAFYYFEIARNFAKVGYFTFDGVQPTNGVQPLWAMLLSVVAKVLSSVGVTDPHHLLPYFFALSSIFNIATGLYLYKISAKWWNQKFALLALSIWLFVPGLVTDQLEGMENSLYAFMLVFTLKIFTSLVERDDTRTPLEYAVLGFTLGLLFLARVDSIILIALLLLWLLLHDFFNVRTRKIVITKFRLFSYAALGFALGFVVLPYLVYNVVTYGHLLPISGAVKTYMAEAVIESFGGRGNPAYLQYTVTESVEAIVVMLRKVWGSILLLSGFWACLHHFWLKPQSIEFTSLPSIVLNMVAVSLVGTVLLIINSRLFTPFKSVSSSISRWRIPGVVKVFVVFTAIQFLTYVFIFPNMLGYAGTKWYFVPQYILLVLVISAALYAILTQFSAKAQLAVHCILVANFILYAQFIAIDYEYKIDHQVAKYLAAVWINTHLPDDVMVGSYNAGIVGYFTDQRVINLDGLVNDFEYLEAQKTGAISEYIAEHNISFIADYTNQRLKPGDSWANVIVKDIVFSVPTANGSTYYIVSVTS